MKKVLKAAIRHMAFVKPILEQIFQIESSDNESLGVKRPQKANGSSMEIAATARAFRPSY